MRARVTIETVDEDSELFFILKEDECGVWMPVTIKQPCEGREVEEVAFWDDRSKAIEYAVDHLLHNFEICTRIYRGTVVE